MARYALLFFLCIVASPACGKPLNVPVAARILAFVQPPVSGALVVTIVFDPDNAASEAEAIAIERQIGVGLVVGRMTIRVRRVAISALAHIAGTRVLFVTSGIRAQQQVAEAAARGAVLTITSDIACVRAGRCVVGITGDDEPLILVNRAAAKAAKIRFGSAFLMLVKEL